MRLLLGAVVAAVVGAGCSFQTDGCTLPRQVSAAGTVTSRDKTPLAGIVLSCDDRDGGLATTNDAGRFVFISSHMFAGAGCQGDCDQVTLRDPSGEFPPHRTSMSVLSQKDAEVVLRRADGG